jgi:hypothetical protein
VPFGGACDAGLGETGDAIHPTQSGSIHAALLIQMLDYVVRDSMVEDQQLGATRGLVNMNFVVVNWKFI